MNKSIISILLIIVIGGSIAAFVFYIKARTPKYKWEPEYSKKSEQPYGLKSFYKFLKEQNKDIKSIGSSELYLLDTSNTHSNFIVVDSYIYLDSINISYLLNYIKKGNNVFISTNESPIYLLEQILPGADSIYEYDQYERNMIDVNFSSSQLPYPEKIRFKHQYLKKVTPFNWSGYSSSYFDDTFSRQNVIPISYINDSIVNCFSISHGKGTLIIHSNPIVFTNFYMIQKNGFKNTNNIFSYLNNGTIYWNEFDFSKLENEGSGDGNPLKFLFSHYTLRTGWYVFLISIFMFILFRSKREQRIIPIIYKNKNTSIEFAKAIGSLYFQKNAHHNIANELYTIFLADIRTRYNMVTAEKKEELIEQISSRTEIKKEIIVDLFKLFSDVKYNVNAKSKDLIKLYQALENFNNIKK